MIYFHFYIYERFANRKDMHDHEKDSLKRFTISHQKNSPTSFRLQDRDNNARWNRNLFVAGVAATWKKPAFNRTREREETRMRASPLHSPFPPELPVASSSTRRRRRRHCRSSRRRRRRRRDAKVVTAVSAASHPSSSACSSRDDTFFSRWSWQTRALFAPRTQSRCSCMLLLVRARDTIASLAIFSSSSLADVLHPYVIS